MPDARSLYFTVSMTLRRYQFAVRCRFATAMIRPPRIPTKLETIVSTGNMIVVASTFGTTSFLIGLVASARSASICSVTFIVPISAVMPAPTLPPTMRDIITGASSRTSDSDTTLPMNIFTPNSSSEYAVCNASTIPMNSDVIATIDSDRTPICSNCSIRICDSTGPRTASRIVCAPSSLMPPMYSIARFARSRARPNTFGIAGKFSVIEVKRSPQCPSPKMARSSRLIPRSRSRFC